MKQTVQRKYALKQETVRVLTPEALRAVAGGQTGATICPTAECKADGTSSSGELAHNEEEGPTTGDSVGALDRQLTLRARPSQ